MLFLFGYKDQISCKSIWDLVPFSFYLNSETFWCTLRNRDIKNHLFFNYFFTLTNRAPVTLFHQLTLPCTLLTNFLHLLVHAWSNLIHLNWSALSFTLLTDSNIRSSFSLTFLTTSHSCMRKFHNASIINVL